ncbi:MAG: hypothetical protein LLG97_21395 [Deltaproteobacteria bacterium]|nr:hypothetical protein [Deltaproteobacteria bacterium]
MKSQKGEKRSTKIQEFWRPGDEIICTRIFRRSDNRCYLCGNTPIEWHHVFSNTISNQTVDIERACLAEMLKQLNELGFRQKILFFKKYAAEAEQLNRLQGDTAGILEFNTNTEVIKQMLATPQALTYKQVRAIIDHTIRFREGVETKLFATAIDLYADRKYYLYEGLREDEKTDNVEQSIKMAIQRDWEEFQAQEEEQARLLHESMSLSPAEEEE